MPQPLLQTAPNIHTHILIVDDSAPMRDCVRNILQQCLPTARLQEAADGAEALQALEHFHADLIISDLNMPGMGGYDLLLTLRQVVSLRHRPVLIMSGNDLEAYRREFEGDAHVDFLPKPFHAADLRKKVQKLLIHACTCA